MTRPHELVAIVNSSAPADALSASLFCSGVLVGKTEVATARHCLKGRTPKEIDLVIDGNNVCRGAAIDGRRVHAAAFRFLPPSEGDIAFVTLDREVSVPPAMSADSHAKVSDPLVAWGWGRIAPGVGSPCTPQPKPLKVVSNSRCAVVEANYRPDTVDKYLCAAPTGKVNTCSKDSGGPTFAFSEGRPVVVALVAAGDGCGPADAGTYVLLPHAPTP